MKDKFETLPTRRWDRVIIWSGGYDSTLLLLRELREFGFAECWTFSFNGYSQPKFKKEKEHREKFKKYAKSMGWKIKHDVIEIKSTIYPKGVLPQQFHWINLILAYGGNETKFIFGFHKKDDYFMYEQQYDQILKSTNICMDKKIEIDLPLKWTDKWKIVKEVRDNHIEKFVWTCEGIEVGQKKPCGECTPCETLQMCNMKIEIENKKPKDK